MVLEPSLVVAWLCSYRALDLCRVNDVPGTVLLQPWVDTHHLGFKR